MSAAADALRRNMDVFEWVDGARREGARMGREEKEKDKKKKNKKESSQNVEKKERNGKVERVEEIDGGGGDEDGDRNIAYYSYYCSC